MNIETIVWLIPLPPLIAFFLIILITNRRKRASHIIAISAAVISWFLSMLVYWFASRVDHLGEHPIVSSIPWIPTGDGWLFIGVQIDPLSAVTLFFVAWTVLMIFIYSVGYHNFGQPKGDQDRPGLPPHGATVSDVQGHKHLVPSIEPLYSRFFAFIGLFAFGMYFLVVSNNLLTLFIGWEIMGFCSYILIGFWYAKLTARAAMIKAFLTTRVGDVFMLLGIAYLYSETGTLYYRDILYNPEVLQELGTTPSGFLGFSVAGLIGLLIFIGAVGKSAQWPLHVWLPDAMEGPTPVSAMIHAATMVSAGVYLTLRIFPLLAAGMEHGHPTQTMNIIAFIGTFTAIFAATIAIAQKDIKRVLAYSTISQLGFMFAAIGIGAYIAAVFHLVMHAFFKALLFLGSGSVIHGMEHGVYHTGNHIDPQDMFNMGGLRKRMPVTFITFLIGGLALAGFPLVTAGFWSKDEIFADAFGHNHWLVFITLALAALLTAYYTMRQITLTFLGESRTDAAKHASESIWTMTLPLIMLAVFAVALGWAGIPEDFPLFGNIIPNYVHEFAGETLLEESKPVNFNFIPLVTSIFVSLGGLGIGWLVYRSIKSGAVDPAKKALGTIFVVLENKYYFDELYDFLFVKPAYWVAENFSYKWMDRKVIDGAIHWVASTSLVIGTFLRNFFDVPVVNGFGDWVGESTKKLGTVFRSIQTGRIQQYMILALVTVAVFTALLYYLLIIGR